MKALSSEDLAAAEAGSYYTIAGVGGSMAEWVEGYEKILVTEEVGKPQEWFTTTGLAVNMYAERTKRGEIFEKDKFKEDLVFLMFPLDGLSIGRLAIVKIQMSDRWFDDMIQNMRLKR